MTAAAGRADAPGTLFDPALLADPHGGYAALRRAGPVHRTSTPDGAPVWLVTRYQDVRAALADPRLSLDKRTAGGSGEHGASMPPELDAHLLNLDPPDHTRIRRLVAKAFTPRAVEALRAPVQRRTDTLLDAIARQPPAPEQPGVDLMEALATPLALAVICDVLGIAEAERRDFRAWTDTLRSPAPDAALSSRQAMRLMHGFLVELIERKRAAPAEDLLSRIIEARDEGDRLTEPELIALAFLLLFAGYDNAANLIGSTLLALLTHADAHRALREGRVTMDQVLDETVRWNTPSMLASRRFALVDLDIAGTAVAAGDRIWLSLVSANRDEAQFPHPADYRPQRPAGPHLAFGHGIHHCLGAALARMEADLAVGTVLRRFPALRLARPPQWSASFRNRGPQHLVVTGLGRWI
ncbi:cytochrome P450 family protein [Kitasatospora mediocidica]|uniref:cytochrome P450 family protein n=1 Tax=Kitasatospora mediocidica TaxID=58352 RepID=UPI0006917B28|nr:cytochrome P450 [Kitasatospora mediocidica]